MGQSSLTPKAKRGARAQRNTASLFMNGRSQAVRLPAWCRFEGQEVYIRRDPTSGDVILSARPADWDGFFALRDQVDVPEGFLTTDRDQGASRVDPFADWSESTS